MRECRICKTQGNFKTAAIEGNPHIFCPRCKVWIEVKLEWPIRTKMYTHRDKDSNHDLADSLGLPESLRRNFAFALSASILTLAVVFKYGNYLGMYLR